VTELRHCERSDSEAFAQRVADKQSQTLILRQECVNPRDNIDIILRKARLLTDL
jgi:hypothetical protein